MCLSCNRHPEECRSMQVTADFLQIHDFKGYIDATYKWHNMFAKDVGTSVSHADFNGKSVSVHKTSGSNVPSQLRHMIWTVVRGSTQTRRSLSQISTQRKNEDMDVLSLDVLITDQDMLQPQRRATWPQLVWFRGNCR